MMSATPVWVDGQFAKTLLGALVVILNHLEYTSELARKAGSNLDLDFFWGRYCKVSTSFSGSRYSAICVHEYLVAGHVCSKHVA